MHRTCIHVNMHTKGIIRLLSQSDTCILLVSGYEDERAFMFKGRRLQILLSTPHSIVNTIWKICIFSEGIIKHALPITITKAREISFLVRCLLMQNKFHCVVTNREKLKMKTNQITPTYLRLQPPNLQSNLTILETLLILSLC